MKNMFTKTSYTDVHSSIISKSQKMESTQMSTNWLMGNQNVVYPYNGILSDDKK